MPLVEASPDPDIEFTYLGDQSGLASAEYEMGLFEYRAGRTRVALPLFESAEKRYALEDSIAGRAHALNAMAVIHLDLGQTDLGVKYLRDAAAAFSDAHDATGEAGTLLNLGTAQQDRCELKDALLSYTQATTNARNAHNLSLAALAQANIAGLYIEMRDPAEARSSAQHALDLCSGITSPESQGWAHLYSGAADILSGDIGHATDEIDAARKSLENTNAVGRIAVKIHEAKLHEANGRPDLADETLTAALALAADAEFDTERVDVLFASAEIFLARNNMKGAKESLEKTKEVCDRGHLSQCDCRSAAERLAQLPPI